MSQSRIPAEQMCPLAQYGNCIERMRLGNGDLRQYKIAILVLEQRLSYL